MTKGSELFVNWAAIRLNARPHHISRKHTEFANGDCPNVVAIDADFKRDHEQNSGSPL